MLALILATTTVLTAIVQGQQITPAPLLSDRFHALRQKRQDTTLPLSVITYGLACEHDSPGCSAQLNLYDACKAEWGDDYYYLYCLCTTGYYDAMEACDSCSMTRGAFATSSYSSEVSSHTKQCKSDSSQFAGKEPNGKTVGGTKGFTASVSASATSGKDGAESSTPSSTTEHSTGGASSTSAAVNTSDLLGGLIGTPTLPQQTATSALVASAASRIYLNAVWAGFTIAVAQFFTYANVQFAF
jgi:hypothetical protein